jgi:membrane associated rhomboid family serine protease
MTILEPQPPRQPFLRLPWPVLFVIGVLATCYAAFALAPPHLQYTIVYDYGFVPARYSQAYLAAHDYNPGSVLDRALPFVTYIFLHGGLGHLAINCIWLLPFGAVVARRYGAGLFFVFFLICGIAGAAAHLAFNWGSTLPVVGASGAISGLMGAAFRMMEPFPPRFEIPPSARALAPILSRRIVVWSAVWVGINVVAGVTGLGTGTQVRLIAWQAHLGGYFAGLFLAGPFAALAGALERRAAGLR